MPTHIIKHDHYLEVPLAPYSGVDDRLRDIDAIIETAARKRRHKVLVLVDGQEPASHIDEIRRIMTHIHKHDWVLRRKGFNLVVAVVTPSVEAAKYARHEKAMSAMRLPMQMFIDRTQALNWLAATNDLSQVVAHYQPIVRLRDQGIVGYEALARKVVDGVLQPPAEWLDALFADPKGSLNLCRHMLIQVLDAFPKIDDNHYISINFEPGDLLAGAYKDIREAYPLAQYAPRLMVEVAERGEVPLDAYRAVELAQDMGARIALDDFGSGSDRLMALIDMVPALIKLDITITHRIEETKVAKLVAAVADFAKSAGTSVLAEGIETNEQAVLCARAGITLGQGYLYGKPEAL
jgi:EAL domain-containing protein (putative c-di-GMP-specific phosphodiesterase class I)